MERKKMVSSKCEGYMKCLEKYQTSKNNNVRDFISNHPNGASIGDCLEKIAKAFDRGHLRLSVICAGRSNFLQISFPYEGDLNEFLDWFDPWYDQEIDNFFVGLKGIFALNYYFLGVGNEA